MAKELQPPSVIVTVPTDLSVCTECQCPDVEESFPHQDRAGVRAHQGGNSRDSLPAGSSPGRGDRRTLPFLGFRTGGQETRPQGEETTMPRCPGARSRASRQLRRVGVCITGGFWAPPNRQKAIKPSPDHLSGQMCTLVRCAMWLSHEPRWKPGGLERRDSARQGWG